MSQEQKPKRNRIISGRFVASTDNLKNIRGKRLDIVVKYVEKGFSNRIISMETVGIRQFAY
jgi:hypothetical protein